MSSTMSPNIQARYNRANSTQSSGDVVSRGTSPPEGTPGCPSGSHPRPNTTTAGTAASTTAATVTRPVSRRVRSIASGNGCEEARHEHLVMIPPGAVVLRAAQPLAHEPVPFVEANGALVPREDPERQLAHGVRAGPRGGGLEKRAAHPQAAPALAHGHADPGDVRRAGVRVGAQTEVADQRSVQLRGELQAARAGKRVGDAPPPDAGATLAGDHEQRDGRLGGDGVEQAGERTGADCACVTHACVTPVRQRRRDLAAQPGHAAQAAIEERSELKLEK